MAVRVSYKNRIGWYTKTERYPGEPEWKFKNWICHANCLWADIWFHKLQEDCREGKKGEMVANLIAFWCDTKHLREALKDGAYHNADNFHFYEDQMDKEIWTAVKLLTKAGKTVIIETKKKK